MKNGMHTGMKRRKSKLNLCAVEIWPKGPSRKSKGRRRVHIPRILKG